MRKGTHSAPMQWCTHSAPMQWCTHSAPMQWCTHSGPTQWCTHSGPNMPVHEHIINTCIEMAYCAVALKLIIPLRLLYNNIIGII